jgi:hypothetical protein
MPGFAHRRHSRRAFLGQSFGLVVGVAGGSLWTGWGARGAAAYFAADGGAPMAFLSTDTVSQGEAFSLHVNSRYATGGMATFNGRQYALYSDAGSGYLIAILGAGQLATDEIEIDPGDYTVQEATPGSVELGISVTPTNFPVDEVDLPPQTAALLAPTLVNAEYQILQTQYTPQIDHRLWQGLFQWPVVGPITTNFGEARSYNGGPVTGHHSGVDIGCDEGTPIAAAAIGRVSYTGQLSERGNFVVVDHGIGVFTGYAHLSEIDVQAGDQVVPGSIIGKAGMTGLATGPHLHWECAVNGVNVDASLWTRILLP